ncbi:DUF3343 domain-containing protein [Bacilliculturomica massiliensis]|uniref:DUF3343 domain-containing protein n=1 Tax=Bacilliculturomica massiliensis TaxID=1917867 RepID=UPI0010320C4E|nr:DUF3343 domain-containing protein [Bacilliculturomica massiliensis]
MLQTKTENRIPFEPEFLLITFSSASHCIETEKKAREDFNVHIIPTPREISASCGMALRFTGTTPQDVSRFFSELDVPSQFFAMGSRGEDGKRPAEKLNVRS